MFYSHQILTSREHGVATIWLVATLGSKASSKKVNKKTILEVNIPGACNVVIQPDIPMALRLQSNLLCGISRVYSQQCGYILLDAQSVQQQMRQLLRVVQHYGNDLNRESARAVRPEQLLLSDDPSFMPDLALDIDMDLLGFGHTSTESSQTDTLLSPHSAKSSKTSSGGAPDIQIGSSSEIGGFHFGDLPVPTSGGLMSGIQDAGVEVVIPEEIDGPLLEPDFTFDEDGNLFEFDDPSTLRTSSHMEQLPPSRAGSRDASQVRTSTQAQARPGSPQDATDLAGPTHDEEDPSMLQPSSTHHTPNRLSAEHVPEEGQITSEESVTAAVRPKKGARRALSADQNTEIRKSQLNAWNKEYLLNMDAARKKRHTIKVNVQAKKNAQWWVWGCGIGGLGYAVRGLDRVNHPLSIFYGDDLKELLTGSRKRRGEDHQDEERRVRQRTSEALQNIDAGGDAIMGGDDEDLELETARHAPTPPGGELGQDLSSSAMPWNLSAAARSARGRLAGSHSGSRTSGLLEQRQRTQPGSRLTSASPLLGRGLAVHPGSRQSSIGPIALGEGAGLSSDAAGDDAIFAGDEFAPPAQDDEFDRFGPAAGVDTQTAADSQWVRQQLNGESKNFLAFAQQAVEERGHQVFLPGAESAMEQRGIAFEELLPPMENTHIVAAQGFHHVLTLVTKGLMWASQDAHEFGAELFLGVTETDLANNGEGELSQ